jgi:hypothetical protein
VDVSFTGWIFYSSSTNNLCCRSEAWSHYDPSCVPPWISHSLDEELVPHLLTIRVVQAKPIFILCVFLFFCFSVRKYIQSGLYVLLLYPLFGTSCPIERPSGLQSALQTTTNLAKCSFGKCLQVPLFSSSAYTLVHHGIGAMLLWWLIHYRVMQSAPAAHVLLSSWWCKCQG